MKTLYVSFILFALAACGDEDGTAPELSDFTITPAQVTTGVQTTLRGTVAFVDPDGDLFNGKVDVIAPSGAVETVTFRVANAAGTTAGTIALEAPFVADEVGAYELELVVVDLGGNESNLVSISIDSIQSQSRPALRPGGASLRSAPLASQYCSMADRSSSRNVAGKPALARCPPAAHPVTRAPRSRACDDHKRDRSPRSGARHGS